MKNQLFFVLLMNIKRIVYIFIFVSLKYNLPLIERRVPLNVESLCKSIVPYDLRDVGCGASPQLENNYNKRSQFDAKWIYYQLMFHLTEIHFIVHDIHVVVPIRRIWAASILNIPHNGQVTRVHSKVTSVVVMDPKTNKI